MGLRGIVFVYYAGSLEIVADCVCEFADAVNLGLWSCFGRDFARVVRVGEVLINCRFLGRDTLLVRRFVLG